LQVVPGDGSDEYPNKEKVYLMGKAFNCSYTDSALGQVTNGWLPDGIAKYKELLEINTRARKSKAGKEWEEELLELIRKELKLTYPSKKEQDRAKRRKSVAIAAASVEEGEQSDIEFEDEEYSTDPDPEEDADPDDAADAE
jgi:hypothetical protein